MEGLNCLLPKPVTVRQLPGSFRISSAFTVRLTGPQSPRITSGVSRFLTQLARRTGLWLDPYQPLHAGLEVEPEKDLLLLNCQRLGDLVLHEDETYTLEVTVEKIIINAVTDLGLLRGLATLQQLLTPDPDGFFFPSVRIEDRPRFPWRGLHIDCARHFQPLEVIKRNLDGMAAVKLNVFHWHLTDDQGFRVECKTFPRLHQCGSNGQFYTQEQIREILSYANDRGIRVVPEFDVPGHTTSWVVAYPELASAPGPYRLESGFGVFDTVLNPAREETYRFLEAFFREMAALFPDEYLHIGGDENNGKQWLANPEIKAFMVANQLQTPHELQSHFTQRVANIVKELNKKTIGWDEILAPNLPSTTIIQSWRGKDSLHQAAKLGYQSILSHGYYLDLMQPAAFHYQHDPLPPEDGLTPQESKLILGGEAAMWCEFVSPETIDSRIWPRAAAIAERLWSPPTHCTLEQLDQRLEKISLHLEEIGLTHEQNYRPMLRRLVGGPDIASLKTLVDLCEPVKDYERIIQCPTTKTYTPLTRVVDAARLESKTAREFHQLVRAYLATLNRAANTDSPHQEKKSDQLCTALTNWLSRWQHNHRLLEPLSENALLREIQSLSADLAIIARLGLEALTFLAEKPKLDEVDSSALASDFYTRQKQALTAAKKPRGQVELAVVPAIEELIEAALAKANSPQHDRGEE